MLMCLVSWFFFFSSRRRHTRCALVTGVQTCALPIFPAMDLPWQEDGTRLFGSELARAQFMDIAIGELDRRRLSWTWIEGEGDARVASALAAIQAAGLG